MDINSRLVQALYRKVTADHKEDWTAFWRYTKYGNQYDYNKEIEKIDINSASEEMKMNLVSLNLKDNEKKYLDCTTYQISPQDSEGRSSVCKYNQDNNTYNSQYAYTKSYIELVYQDLYGKDSKLDTSLPLYMDQHGVEKYVYIDNLDMYILYPVEGGGASRPGGYTTNISKAIENDNIVKIYQDVIKTEYKEVNGIKDENNESSKITSNYTLVYTFKLDSDGMYNFVSVEKKD